MKWDMIPFDVQLIGAYALHSGKIAEMATGEGRPGRDDAGVPERAQRARCARGDGERLLAARDSEWMGAVYKFLGLTVGCILHDQPRACVASNTTRTSLTELTRSSGSITCEITHGFEPQRASPARPLLRDRR